MSRLRLVVLISYVLLVFALSTRAYMTPPGPEFHLKDKVAHLIEYSVLGVLLFSALGRAQERAKWLTFVLLLSLGAAVAATDEMIQGLVPGRSRDIYDWMADLIGVSLGVAAYLLASDGHAEDAGDGGVAA